MKNIDNDNVFNIKHTQLKKKPHEQLEKSDLAVDKVSEKAFGCSNNSLSEIIGRSQVSYTYMNDSFENDIKLFVENPAIIENVNKFFDLAYNKYQNSMDAAYEYSTVLSRAYHDMFYNNL